MILDFESGLFLLSTSLNDMQQNNYLGNFQDPELDSMPSCIEYSGIQSFSSLKKSPPQKKNGFTNACANAAPVL